MERIRQCCPQYESYLSCTVLESWEGMASPDLSEKQSHCLRSSDCGAMEKAITGGANLCGVAVSRPPLPLSGEAVFGPERRALTLGILLAIGAFAVEGMGVVPALPSAVRALGGLPLFGWAFSAFMLAWLVGTVGGGLIADARGPRLPMALGLLAFGAGLALAGTAHHMAQFLGGRALQGSGGGAMIAAGYVAIARGYPDEVRARMMALTASVWILPAIVGPALSGAVVERAGWRLVFAGILPVLAVAAVVVLPPLALRRAARVGRRRARWFPCCGWRWGAASSWRRRTSRGRGARPA